MTLAPAWALEESEEGWAIDPLQAEVTQIRVDFAFTLIIDQLITLRIESDFAYFDGERVIHVDPEVTIEQEQLLSLHNIVVQRLNLTRKGKLTIEFADRRSISIGPNPSYESFSLGVPGAGLFIGMVGAEVAHFSDPA